MTHIRPILDLSDIQGNILRGYPRFKFARFMLFRILSADGGKRFLDRLSFLVTPGEWGEQQPPAAVNVGLSFAALEALKAPRACLASFPVEYQEGMKARLARLGDRPEWWESPWNAEPVHVVVMVYAASDEERERQCREISRIVEDVNRPGGGPRIESLEHQNCQWLTVDGEQCRREHFGFEDGISNPDVEGVPRRGGQVDSGNPDDRGVFRKIPVGEFILGHRGEGGEVAPMPLPRLLGRNGAYLVIRKLEQHVGKFRDFVRDASRRLRNVPDDVDPAHYLAAKMVGRWMDGSPLVLHPERSAMQAVGRPDPDNTFRYSSDLAGASCPLGAHIRRVNPRDSMGFGGKIMSRRRLIRRGIAYGEYLPDGAADTTGEGSERESARGIMFVAFCSGLDQFEFVQQAWIGQGDDFQQGNDMDPLVGSRDDRQMMISRRRGDGSGAIPLQRHSALRDRKRRRIFLCAEPDRAAAVGCGRGRRVMNEGPVSQSAGSPGLAAPDEKESRTVTALRDLRWVSRLGQTFGAVAKNSPPAGGVNGIVTAETYERILDLLEPPDRPLQLTRFERIERGEAVAIARMARRAAVTVLENYCDAKRRDANAIAMRDQHAKPHGYLKARFVVRRDLPPGLAVGVFRPGASYDARVQFSNARGDKGPDRRGDGRGMAIKLKDAPGPSFLPPLGGGQQREDDSTEQDFLLTNYPVFFGKNASDYSEFLEIVALPQDTLGAKARRFARIGAFFFPFRLWQLWIFLRTAMQAIKSPLSVTYHSMTPYLLGDETVVRYVAAPVRAPGASLPSDRGRPKDDFLRAAMIAELDPRTHSQDEKAIFDFAVQIRDTPTPDDVEDASLPWGGAGDVRVSIATIEIPVQNFDEAALRYEGEKASFNPWRCLPQHRPLGGLNRMRLAVYRASLDVRRRMNMVAP